jgi:hypothetical protein
LIYDGVIISQAAQKYTLLCVISIKLELFEAKVRAFEANMEAPWKLLGSSL